MDSLPVKRGETVVGDVPQEGDRQIVPCSELLEHATRWTVARDDHMSWSLTIEREFPALRSSAAFALSALNQRLQAFNSILWQHNTRFQWFSRACQLILRN